MLREDGQTTKMELIALQYRSRDSLLQAKRFEKNTIKAYIVNSGKKWIFYCSQCLKKYKYYSFFEK